MRTNRFRVLVSIDLFDADLRQRRVFGQEMRRRDWTRYPHSKFAYCAEFRGGESDAVSVSELDVAEAAAFAQIESWDGVCLVEDLVNSPGV